MATIYKRSDRGGRAGKWYAEFTNELGEREKKCTGTRDKRAAEEIASAWETEAAKKRAGLIDPQAERIKEQNVRPIAAHIDEYCDSLKSAKKSQAHQTKTRSKIDTIVAATGWNTFRDVTSESLERFLVQLAETKVRGKDKGSSARTIASYVQAIRGFVRWSVKTNRVAYDPLQHVKRPNPEGDRRIKRRMILPAEWPWLMKSIDGASYGMAPSDRRLLYELAVQTAYRSEEIRSLLVAHVDTKNRIVSLPSNDTKNTDRATQHVTAGLAIKLDKFIKDRAGNEPLFRLCNPTNMARMIKRDFADARSKWIASFKDDRQKAESQRSDFLATVNHADEVVDFHALRHTCGAWLAVQGVHPKTIQAIMRHSTITLTLDTYGHLMPGAEPEAIQKLESFCGV